MTTPRTQAEYTVKAYFKHEDIKILGKKEDAQELMKGRVRTDPDLADQAWYQEYNNGAIDATGTEFDLTSLAQVDVDGNTLDTLDMSGGGVQALIVINEGANELIVTDGASNGWIGSAQMLNGTNPEVRVRPYAMLFIGAGSTNYTVTASLKTVLLQTASGTTNAKVLVVGKS